MKVVHSFVDNYNCLWKELAYSQFLSAVLAKEHYGNISFYSTPEIVKQVQDLGMDYDTYNTDIVGMSDFDTWSVTKLKTFRDFKEPFLHIDNDTFIIDKINFSKKYTFSHLDTNFRKLKVNLDKGFDSIIGNTRKSKGKLSFLNTHNQQYLNLFFKLMHKLPDEVVDEFHLSSIPNMNITYVEDPETFTKAVDLSLGFYNNNKKVIDKDKYGPCFIEQLLIHQALRSLDPDYKRLSKKFKHVLFKEIPFIADSNSFPFKGKYLGRCNCCKSVSKNKFTIENELEMKEFLDFNFDGFLHTTYMKWWDAIQAWTIHQLRKRVGDQVVLDIHKYFYDLYKKFDLPTTSSGEEFYGKISNFSFK